jgi:NAD(P)-dependent dehydrogenase (short-subunit alcohol dehydrogenase family)
MTKQEMRFDDDVVIVTGAGRGLGREYALAFAARGAKVLVNALQPAGAHAVVEEIRAAGGQAVSYTRSVTDREGAESIVAAAVSAFGKVTVLVNNAGIINNTPFAEVTAEQWKHMAAVNLDGAYNMAAAVWPVFVTNGYGRIVNVTSNVGYAGLEKLVHYGATKLGVAGLTKGLAHETGDLDIRVNAIAPLAVTRMNHETLFGKDDPTTDDWQADIREGRSPMAPPVAVAPTVLWLTHRSTKVNGEIYSTTSGKVARVAFVVGEGYFNPDHTPEDLRDNIETVRALADYLDGKNAFDEVQLIASRFQQGATR